MEAKFFIEQLKNKKKRITPGREKIIEIFCNTHSPILAENLIIETKLNKTSVYREINFLLKENIIREVHFSDRAKRYELKERDHHHHLVCLNCKNVSDISIEEKFEVPSFLSKIKEENKFQIIKHNLEFFGYCQNCTN